MERYERYKDSGVKWIGEIPEHWEVLSLKFIFKLRKQLVGKESNKYKLLSLTLQGVILRDMDNPMGKFPSSFDNYQVVEPGNFIFCNFDNEETPRAVGMSYHRGMITGAYDVFTVYNNEMDSRFLLYYCLYIDDAKRFKPLYKGLRKTVPFDSFMSYKIPVPPKSEQTAIANYLDSVTSKIDEAISQQRKMIDLLNERKQIIIQNAVTKGLDPNAKMKDSGVEWIGEIPEDWEVKKLNSIGDFSKGANISRNQLNIEGDCLAILYGDIYTKYNIRAFDIKNRITRKTASNSVRIFKGDILMTGSGETKEDIGKTIYFENEEAYIGGDIILFRQRQVNGLFLTYALNSFYAKAFRYKESKGEIVVHIYSNALKNIRIALPPNDAQQKIVDFLNDIFVNIGKTISNCNKMISLLQERKQIIINDVVTGKVKVV